MKECKSKLIIKMRYAVSVKKDKGRLNMQRAQEKFEFEKQLIEKFSGCTLEYISTNYTLFRKRIHNLEPLVYNDKPWLGYMEVGYEMLKDKYGIVCEHHYNSLYLAVPKVETEIISFIQSIQPTWFKTVSKI